MPTMTVGPKDIEDAARRLRGTLVATPLVAEPLMPGFRVPRGLRLKLELLQCGTSIWFRGAMHSLARRLGATAAVVSVGSFRQVLAEVVAAALQRIAVDAVVVGVEQPDRRALLEAAGAATIEFVNESELAHRRAAAGRSARPIVGSLDDPDYLAGIATVGIELAEELPVDVETVVISPSVLAPAARLGIDARGRALAVVGIDPDPRRATAVAAIGAALAAGQRVCSDPIGLAALDAVVAGRCGEAPCVVLTC